MEMRQRDIWGDDAPQQALRQVADLCNKVAPLDLRFASDGLSFFLAERGETQPQGILSAHGRLGDDVVISLKVELFRGPDDVRVFAGKLCRLISRLGDKIRLCPPPDNSAGTDSIWAELRVKAEPIALTRAETMLKELNNLNQLAKLLQAELPAALSDGAIEKRYAELTGTLAPVYPWNEKILAVLAELRDFGRQAWDFLSGGSSIAIAAPFPIQRDAALAILAWSANEHNRTLGRLVLPSINARGFMEVSRKAPGTVAASVTNISLASSPYELGNEMMALLASLTEANTPGIFVGRFEDLQAVFHGGQGGLSDPLQPVLVHAPEVPLDSLTRFALISAGRNQGGLPQSALDDLTAGVLGALGGLPPAKQIKILPVAALKAANAWASGRKSPPAAITEFAARAAGLSETLSGLSPRPRVIRRPEVQELFTRVLTNPSLFDFLEENLMAQNLALRCLVNRLAGETLTRPLHQPIRYCALGTPATGKSESAALLALRLDIPLINIDAASMSDYHTAAAQLLGSGRGIVGSHQSGRLEQAAKHHKGVVVEVSDIDHAVPSVKSYMSDLFLQVLDTGEAQSSIGPKFSCANVIFAFTMNLPGGMDERIRTSTGFSRTPNRKEVTRGVAAEVKSLLSGAFLSRIGTPIIFDPLEGIALVQLIERAIRNAVRSAVDRLSFPVAEVAVEPGCGEAVLACFQSNLVSFGARSLLEHARDLSSRAVLAWVRSAPPDNSSKFTVSVDPDGYLFVVTSN